MPPCGRVVPTQSSLLPTDVQVQDAAVPLENTVRQLLQGNGHIPVVLQSIPGQARAVVLARFVEAPILGYAQRGVILRLVPGINFPGARRRYFQHEVRRLPLVGDNVAVAGIVQRGIHAKGYQQVGIPAPGEAPRWTYHQVPVAGHQGGFGIAEVHGKVMGVAVGGQMVEAGHLVFRLFRRVRQPERFRGFWILREGVGGGHAGPSGARRIICLPCESSVSNYTLIQFRAGDMIVG